MAGAAVSRGPFRVVPRGVCVCVCWRHMLDPETLRAFERACSADNRQCVAAKQYFDDWARSVPEMVRKHTDLKVCVEHLPGMQMGSAYTVNVTFLGAQLGRPVSINKSGDVDNHLTPTRARLENLTYASPLYVSLRVETQAPSGNGGTVYKGSVAENVFLGTGAGDGGLVVLLDAPRRK